MGAALAEAARDRGARVTLVHGSMTVDVPAGVDARSAPTAREMHDAVRALAPMHDVLIMAAAVADYAPAHPSTEKIKRDASDLELTLKPNADIVAEVGHLPPGERPFVVGFAAETADLAANARGKLAKKGLDLVVANRVDSPRGAIGSKENQVSVFGADGELAAWPSLPKRQVAERLWDLIMDRYRRAAADAPAATTTGRD